MRIIVSGGGTGGHIYPALALIEYIKKLEPKSKFLFVGSKRGLESQIVPAAKVDFVALDVQGFSRSISLTNFKTVSLFNKAVRDSKKIIEEFKPDIIVGTGGYVSGAVLYAGQRLNIPTVIHEQNSVAGVTNRFLSRGADHVAVTFTEVSDQFPKVKVVHTGNPRAQQVASIKSKFDFKSLKLKNKPTVLIFGGSQGAPAINSDRKSVV
jgi:UDP-N-acetylglucosamine--N-acetylmuramyl-(pentapeptide) pyrophosphoryl-undecaprenol N-acetylglucosamine transferase